MAASGSVLLAPVPAAAAAYAATILIPLVFKCLIVLGDRYVALGALAVSFLVFLLALIATNARMFIELLRAVNQLKSSFDALNEARDETERMAMTDGLTGVANRGAFISLAGRSLWATVMLQHLLPRSRSIQNGETMGSDMRSAMPCLR
jgi:predicted signal transduction protein with EAL and GGDEF domain